MRRLKPVAIAMVFVMLMPMLMSCSSGIKKNTVVKADDPWYETTKFKLDFNIRQDEQQELSCVCACEDRIFSVYTLTSGQYASSRTVLDTYDMN